MKLPDPGTAEYQSIFQEKGQEALPFRECLPEFPPLPDPKPLVPFIARGGALRPGESESVDLTPGDLVYGSYTRHWGQLHRAWVTSKRGHSLSGAAWRVFNLIVVDASPGRNSPFRLVLYRDADIARTLEGMTRATVAKARKALQEAGYIRLVKTIRGGYIWILREPGAVPFGTLSTMDNANDKHSLTP